MAYIEKEQKKRINFASATSLAFDRLGAILHEIAKDAADKFICREGGEGNRKCKNGNRSQLNCKKHN
jgi:hypothetical protein